MALPGKSIMLGARLRYVRPSDSIAPHSAAGGLAPRPRNDNAEMDRSMIPSSSEVMTTIGPTMLGSTCSRRMRGVEAPAARAAWM